MNDSHPVLYKCVLAWQGNTSIVHIVDCSTIECIDTMVHSVPDVVDDDEEKNDQSDVIVIHLSPSCVMNHPTYQRWCQRTFGSSVTTYGLRDTGFIFVASAEQQAQLHGLDPAHFDLPRLQTSKTDSSHGVPLLRNGDRLVVGYAGYGSSALHSSAFDLVTEATLQSIADAARATTHSVIVPPSNPPPTLPTLPTLPLLVPPPVPPPVPFQSPLPPLLPLLPLLPLSHLPPSPPPVPVSVVFLGTGSAAPSKLRGGSAIHIRVPNYGGLLLDCGEGTLGALMRKYGNEYEMHALHIRCVWISHAHLDHQGGLLRFLHHRQELLALSENAQYRVLLPIVGPSSVHHFLNQVSPSLQRSCAFVTFRDFNFPQHPVRQALLNEAGRHRCGPCNVRSVPVHHCPDAHGLVLDLWCGERIVYSGDTRPCESLVREGFNASLLIHEATFDDTMQEDAKKKRHSTFSEALGVAARMQARRVVLTHFSQRYPRIGGMTKTKRSTRKKNLGAGDVALSYQTHGTMPTVLLPHQNVSAINNTCVAFDGMEITLLSNSNSLQHNESSVQSASMILPVLRTFFNNLDKIKEEEREKQWQALLAPAASKTTGSHTCTANIPENSHTRFADSSGDEALVEGEGVVEGEVEVEVLIEQIRS